MKIKNCEGEYAFKALVAPEGGTNFKLSSEYFFNKEDAVAYYSVFHQGQLVCFKTIHWPVEVFDDGLIYIPSGSDLE